MVIASVTDYLILAMATSSAIVITHTTATIPRVIALWIRSRERLVMKN